MHSPPLPPLLPSPPPPFPFPPHTHAHTSQCPVLTIPPTLVQLVFTVMTSAMQDDPANKKFFENNVSVTFPSLQFVIHLRQREKAWEFFII